MKITISTEELIYNIKSKSHTEVARIADPEQKYIAEAGTDKLDEIRRCALEGKAEMESLIFRFLAPETASDKTIENTDVSLGNTFEFEFVGTPRRYTGKATAIRDQVFALLTNLAMAKFYISVNQIALSNARRSLANDALAMLERLLYTKRTPIADTTA